MGWHVLREGRARVEELLMQGLHVMNWLRFATRRLSLFE